MSGTRYYNYRQGDRSEYLATYFFSAIGLVTPVPRQEDIGFDFVCSIADQNCGRLTFNNQYLVSIKSYSTPNIELYPAKSEDGTLPHIGWLFKQELPFLLAVVNKETQEFLVYSTLPIWFIYYENFDCGGIVIKPRLDDSTIEDDVGRPKKCSELEEIKGKYIYEVDLGFPILRAKVFNLNKEEEIERIKTNLRRAIEYARYTSLHVQLGVPYFYWFAKTFREGSLPIPAFYAAEVPNESNVQQHVYKNIAPSLISLALLYKKTNVVKYDAAVQLLKSVPREQIPNAIREHLTELKS